MESLQMANKKQAGKRAKQAVKRQTINETVKSATKTAVRKAIEAVTAKDMRNARVGLYFGTLVCALKRRINARMVGGDCWIDERSVNEENFWNHSFVCDFNVSFCRNSCLQYISAVQRPASKSSKAH